MLDIKIPRVRIYEIFYIYLSIMHVDDLCLSKYLLTMLVCAYQTIIMFELNSDIFVNFVNSSL